MFFDLNKLQAQSKGDSNVMLKMLENYHYNRIPRNNKDRVNFSKVSLFGDSFIINPERLFAAKVDVNYKVQYIILAAKRDYLFYKHYNITYLDLSFFPDLHIDKIKGNPLFEIKETKLYFKI